MLAVNEHCERLHRWQEGVVHLFVLGYVSEVQVDVSDKGDNVGLLELQAELVVLHPAEGEQLVDEAHHAVGAFLHGANGLSQVGGDCLCVAYAVHGTTDDGEGRAELVADVSEELQFIFRQFLFDADAAAQLIDGA